MNILIPDNYTLENDLHYLNDEKFMQLIKEKSV